MHYKHNTRSSYRIILPFQFGFIPYAVGFSAYFFLNRNVSLFQFIFCLFGFNHYSLPLSLSALAVGVCCVFRFSLLIFWIYFQCFCFYNEILNFQLLLDFLLCFDILRGFFGFVLALLLLKFSCCVYFVWCCFADNASSSSHPAQQFEGVEFHCLFFFFLNSPSHSFRLLLEFIRTEAHCN